MRSTSQGDVSLMYALRKYNFNKITIYHDDLHNKHRLYVANMYEVACF